MSVNLDELSTAQQPVDIGGIPNHYASGESGDGIKFDTSTVEGKGSSERPGIFGRRFTGRSDKPRMGTARPKVTTVKPEVPKLAPIMKQKITDLYVLIGGALVPFDPELGQTIVEQAPACGKAVYDFAQDNAVFRRVIQGFLTTSLWGAIVFAHLPIFLMMLRKSRSERVRMTAGMMMVAMRLMSQEDADKAFPEEEPEDTKEYPVVS